MKREIKPRNHVVFAMIRSNKRSSVHGKSVKAARKAEKMQLAQNLKSDNIDKE